MGRYPIAVEVMIGTAFMANQHLTSAGRANLGLEYACLTILEACCAKPMRWFGALCLFFQGISQRLMISGNRLQLIPLLLSFPCFEASHFFFKLGYAFQSRKLLLAGGEDLFLKFYNRRVADGSVVDVLQSLRRIKEGLEDAEASDKFRGHL